MKIPHVDPTALQPDVMYLCLAQAGRHFTGYVGAHYFTEGRCSKAISGSEVSQGMLNAVHVYPWVAGVAIDWREETPRVFLPEPPVLKAQPPPAPAKPADAVPVEPMVDDPTPEPEPVKRGPGRPRKVK